MKRARKIEHPAGREVAWDAVDSLVGEQVYVPAEREQRALDEALIELRDDPESGRCWPDARREIFG